MKREIVIELFLIGVLAVYGCLLTKILLASHVDLAKEAVDASNRSPFTDGIGIDSSGLRFDPAKLLGVHRLIAFILRSKSLDSDVTFWNDVEKLLPKGSGVKLIGYCDGDDCVNALSKNQSLLRFPAIAYGEVVDSEALFNADQEGNFVLVDKGKYARFINWRGSGRTIADVARTILP